MADTTTPYLDRDALVRGVRAARWRDDGWLTSPALGRIGCVESIGVERDGRTSTWATASAGPVRVEVRATIPDDGGSGMRVVRRHLRAALLDAVRHYASQGGNDE